LVNFAGIVLILFYYLFDQLLSDIRTEPEAVRLEIRNQVKQRNFYLFGLIFLLSFLGVGSLYVMLRFHSLQGQALIWLLGIIFSQIVMLNKPLSYTTTTYHWVLKCLIASPFAFFLGCTLQGFYPSTPLIFLGVFVYFGTASAYITLMFRQYAGDLNRKRQTFLVSVGWEKGIFLHRLLFVGSVILLTIYVIISNSSRSNWPALAWQIFGIYEVFLIEQLAKGVKPNFVLLDVLAIFRTLGAHYLLIYALLIH